MDEEKMHELVDKVLAGTLTDAERAIVDRLTREDQAFAGLLARDRKLTTMVGDGATAAFRPGFDRRVMARIAEERRTADDFFSVEVSDLISHFFPRLVGPAFVAASMLMAFNFSTASAETPLMAALLGWPAPAYDELIVPF